MTAIAIAARSGETGTGSTEGKSAGRKASPDSPPTQYLKFLLATDRTRQEAGAEARRLGIRPDYAEFWFNHVRR